MIFYEKAKKERVYMSYQKSYYDKDYDKKSFKDCHKSNKHYENCVEEVLEAILEAQKKVKEDHDCCKTSCKESIDELLHEKKPPKKNTIPFILYCGCEPFKGTGVTTYSCHSKKKRFKCVESFIFKIKDLEKGCAVLELLTFKTDHKHSDSDGKHECKDLHSVCSQIDHKCVSDLVETGICITVDLSCFCAISCLPAVYFKKC